MLLLNYDAATYHEKVALSASTAKHLLRSPAHYLKSKEGADSTTLPMRFGTLVHMLVLEPDMVPKRVEVRPGMASRKLKGGREEADAWEALPENTGRMLFDLETFQRAQRTANAVLNHPQAGPFFKSGCITEATVFWTETIDGNLIPCKARLDCFREPDNIVVDLKTAQDASPEGFRAACRQYKYHLQAAHYARAVEIATGKRPDRFLFVAVESEEPHGVGVYEIDEESVRIGEEQMRRAASLFVRAHNPAATAAELGYAQEVVKLNLGLGE
jgi:hypothetical protein